MATAYRPRGRRWTALSRRIVQRDGGRCHICGKSGANTADHLTPTSRGGAWWDESNLAAAHRSCNSRRGNRVILHSRPSRRW
jgi:5-methylcytosine-specific restriction endonuclease McrA